MFLAFWLGGRLRGLCWLFRLASLYEVLILIPTVAGLYAAALGCHVVTEHGTGLSEQALSSALVQAGCVCGDH